MTGQMSIYDFIQTFDPVRELARKSVWGDGRTPTRNRLISYMNGSPKYQFWKDVQREFCPYGCAGMRSHSETPNKITGYDMTTKKIDITYNDESGTENHVEVTWQEFADNIRRELKDD